MRMLLSLCFSIAMLSATSAAPAREAPKWTYYELLEYQDTPEMRSFVIGIGWGVFWTGIYATSSGLNAGFCIPREGPGIDGNMLIRMALSYGDRHEDMRDTPLGLLFAYAFAEAFPC